MNKVNKIHPGSIRVGVLICKFVRYFDTDTDNGPGSIIGPGSKCPARIERSVPLIQKLLIPDYDLIPIGGVGLAIDIVSVGLHSAKGDDQSL